ncbi:MAG: tRNA pseudouridine(38-40) synthase TruA [Kiritimatiellae bacterium]|nr:tRNA pseudouridine(38-40) synthase TruA [Kiritimatiellia bacterium]
MPRYRILVAYDGTDFKGWQRQPGERTVQSALEDSLAPLLAAGESVAVHGSGRTDAGVHARGQTAHFDLMREIDPDSLRRAMNNRLDADVRVLSASPAAPDFDARRSAHSKEYRYFVWNAEEMDPAKRRSFAHVPTALDVDAMRRAARKFVGEHDFAAFSANPQRPVESTIRTIHSLEIADNPPEIEIRVSGNGFLYKMVRSISGFLISVGAGKASEAETEAIFASGKRTARVESAPACGLSLWRVWYENAGGRPGAEEPAWLPRRRRNGKSSLSC